MNQFDLKNRTALITGGAQGFGFDIAKKFLNSGANVIIWDIDEKELQNAVKKINNSKLSYNVADVSNFEKINQTVFEINKKTNIDILINNAGITKDALLMKMKDEDWNEVIDTNLKSVFKLSQSVIRKMIKNKYGRIINISSVVGHTGNPGQSNYTAAKAGISGFTKSLAQEVGSRGITVNCVAPGFIDTDMTRSLPDDYKNQLLGNIPLGRLGNPVDIANAVAFLVSNKASYITGETIHINGGMLMI